MRGKPKPLQVSGSLITPLCRPVDKIMLWAYQDGWRLIAIDTAAFLYQSSVLKLFGRLTVFRLAVIIFLVSVREHIESLELFVI